MQNYTNNSQQISDLPQVATLDYQPMSPEYPLLVITGALSFWLVLSLGIAVIDYLLEPVYFPWLAYAALFTVSIINLVISFFSAKARGFVLREKDIIYKEGIWWRKRTGVSFKRVQHIDITHGPLERKFDIASVKFFTAGGASADLTIPGLNKNDAENLRHHVLQKTGLIDEQG